jgi:hypothetical protein
VESRFQTNLEVDVYNYHKLQSLEGEMKVYHSQDEGSQHYLNKFVAQKNLGLKINCPVILQLILPYLPQHQVVLVEHNSHNQLQVLVVSFLEIYVWLYQICSDNPSEYGDDDIASDDDNDHHDNDNLDETLILDDSDFFYSEIDQIDFIENHNFLK